MTPENAARMSTKAEMVVDRGGFRKAKCDLCRKNGTDMHEIISRGRTLGNGDARQASYQKEVCALLCPSCHERAHNPNIALILLAKNIRRYGYDRVQQVWNEVASTLNTRINLAFPSRADWDQLL